MPHPPWEDLSEFFDLSEFAVTAVVRRDGTEIGEVRGIFDDPNVVSDLGEYEFDHPTPQFVCKETDVSAVRKGDVLEVIGRVYDIMREPQLDGTGIATLILSEPNVIYAGL